MPMTYLVRDKQRTIYGWDLDRKAAQTLAVKLRRGNPSVRVEPIRDATRAYYTGGGGELPADVVRGDAPELELDPDLDGHEFDEHEAELEVIEAEDALAKPKRKRKHKAAAPKPDKPVAKRAASKRKRAR